MREKPLFTVELNGGVFIEVYKNSILFNNDEEEECWEYDWKELYHLTDMDNIMDRNTLQKNWKTNINFR